MPETTITGAKNINKEKERTNKRAKKERKKEWETVLANENYINLQYKELTFSWSSYKGFSLKQYTENSMYTFFHKQCMSFHTIMSKQKNMTQWTDQESLIQIYNTNLQIKMSFC